MDFQQAMVAIEVLTKYSTDETYTVGGKEREITGEFEFWYEQCWITLPRVDDLPQMTLAEFRRMHKAGWFVDREQGAWSHY